MRKVVAFAEFMALSWQLPRVTEENKENLSRGKLEHGRKSKRVFPEYQSE
jgi:hypothetical protein